MLRAALSLGVVALLAVALLAGVFALTRERIASAELSVQQQAMAIVLPPESYDNDLLADRVSVRAPAWLGSTQALLIHRARRHGQPVALVLETVAPGGYAGPIRLLIAVNADGRISGVTVISQFPSATVTPRAVVKAVRLTLEFVARHGNEIYLADNHATVVFDDAPEVHRQR